MEMFKKVMNVLSTLIPVKTITFSKVKGTYMFTVTNVWCGRSVSVSVPVKDLV